MLLTSILIVKTIIYLDIIWQVTAGAPTGELKKDYCVSKLKYYHLRTFANVIYYSQNIPGKHTTFQYRLYS